MKSKHIITLYLDIEKRWVTLHQIIRHVKSKKKGQKIHPGQVEHVLNTLVIDGTVKVTNTSRGRRYRAT